MLSIEILKVNISMSVPLRAKAHTYVHDPIRGRGKRPIYPCPSQVQSCHMMTHIIAHIPLLSSNSIVYNPPGFTTFFARMFTLKKIKALRSLKLNISPE
jgi:hypothetical protein